MYKKLIIIGLLIVILAGLCYHQSTMRNMHLRTRSHLLWMEHVAYTRLYLISVVNNLPDTELVLARLMKNQEQIGGNDKVLVKLLKEHIAIAGDIVGTLIKKVPIDKLYELWKMNAYQIANQLAISTLHSPHLVKKMTDEMYHHLMLTRNECSAYVNKDYEGSIEYYDKAMGAIIKFSNFIVSKMN